MPKVNKRLSKKEQARLEAKVIHTHKGKIDLAKLWDVELSPSTVKKLINENPQ